MATYGEQEEGVEEVGGDELNKKLTQKNTLPVYGNKETMNINPMILSNIQGSAYFKEELYTLKTFHEVVDEIFYKVGLFVKLFSVFIIPLPFFSFEFLSPTFPPSFCFLLSLFRWTTWSRGKKAVGSLLDKWGCVEG